MSMNASSFLRLTGHKSGDAQLPQSGHTLIQTCPLYTGSGFILLSLNITANSPHLAYSDGTIYSALSENSVTPTIKAFKTFVTASCRFGWRGTLTMKVPTANLSGHRLFLTAGE